MKQVYPKLIVRLVTTAFLLALLGVVINQSTSTAIAADAPQANDPIQVDIVLSEWALTPPDFNFQAGDRVIFNVINEGRFGHAFQVSENGIHQHSSTISGGETTTLETTFEFGGTYRILCPIPGHEQLGMVGEITVSGGEAAPSSDEYLGIPLLRVTPRSGTEVEGTSQEVGVIFHDFTLAPDDIGNSQNTPGQGHWDLFLDDELADSIGTTSFTLENLTPGEHTVRAALRNNDGTALKPAIEATSTIQVAAPATPSVGDTAIPRLAQSSLIAALVLITSGSLILFLRRRSRTA